MTTPPIQPPVAPTAVAVTDPFDKALALAEVFTQREIASITASYDRFFKIITAAGAIALVLFGFFGWKNYREVTTEVQAEVRAKLPEIVEAEVSKQFDTQHVQATVEAILTREVRADLERMVTAEVTQSLQAELKRQQPLIEASVQRRTATIVNELSPTISSVAAEEARKIVTQQLAPRRLNRQQIAKLVLSLKSVPKYPAFIFTDTENEQVDFGDSIKQAFLKAGWTTDTSAHHNDTKVVPDADVLLVAPTQAMADAMKAAFESVGVHLAVRIEGSGPMMYMYTFHVYAK